METLEKGIKSVRSVVNNIDHKEGKVARFLEKQTAKIPSDAYLWAAVGSIGASLTFKFLKKDSGALFIGQWVSAFLLLGIYNKIVKVAGSDKSDSAII